MALFRAWCHQCVFVFSSILEGQPLPTYKFQCPITCVSPYLAASSLLVLFQSQQPVLRKMPFILKTEDRSSVLFQSTWKEVCHRVVPKAS